LFSGAGIEEKSMIVWGDMKTLARFAMAILILLLWVPSVLARTEIMNLRYWAAPEHTRVVIDTGDEVQFTVEKSPPTILLNLKDTVLSKTMPREFVLNKPGITKIVLSPLKTGDVKIELFLTENVDTNIFKLKKFQDKPHRVVVDIGLPEVEKENSQAREKVKVLRKDKIIVIDPGHGGEDPGARGHRGTNEKDVVLEMSRKLKDVLNAGEGTRAFLTREGDYYVSFKKRLSMAREFGADLFISIHADAARNRAAAGSSVYCLSTGGASTEAARILARKENMADIVGGSLSEGNGSDESAPIILDMFQNNTINKSRTFGASILGGFCRINDIKFSNVQEAPFRVLKLPEIPAILIETAYISNPQEERDLKDKEFQGKVARTIAGSVREFFSLPATTDTSPAMEKVGTEPKVKSRGAENSEPVASVYKVAKGDTLLKIAAKHHTEVGALLKLNGMKLNDPLYVGRVLKVALSDGDRKDKKEEKKAKGNRASQAEPSPAVHKVKKGDTLAKIAVQYRTKMSVLMKLNHLKPHDPLYAGIELKLPRREP